MSKEIENIRAAYQEVQEKLKGGQHKLDHDGDGDIDGKDFAMLRNKKKKKTDENYFVSFTPQLFNFDKLIKSYNNVVAKNIAVDDDLEVMHVNSYAVRILKSSPFNIKLTYIEDLEKIKRVMKVL